MLSKFFLKLFIFINVKKDNFKFYYFLIIYLLIFKLNKNLEMFPTSRRFNMLIRSDIVSFINLCS